MIESNHKICPYPFTSFNAVKHSMHPCCASWMNDAIIPIIETNDIHDLWFNRLNTLRDSIINGSYSYCKTSCPIRSSAEMQIAPNLSPEIVKYIESGEVTYPSHVGISFDETCNLKCKTCRKEIIVNSSDEVNKYHNKYSDIIHNASTLRISGDGDPFASSYYFGLLKSDLTEVSPNINTIIIQTNGMLFNETNFNKIHDNNKKLIRLVTISIDATSPETYKNVRGGNFITLCSNLEYIKSLKSLYNFSVHSVFTISKNNIHEAVEFIKFANTFGIDNIRFDLMENWGRGYSTEEIGIDLRDVHVIELLTNLKTSVDSTNYATITFKIPTKIIQPNKLIMNKKPDKHINAIINSDNITVPDQHNLELLTELPSKQYAVFCPFYISEENEGKWIEHWIENVAKFETGKKFYSISYPKSLDISKYISILDKLNEIATCILNEPDIYHTTALKYAHDYLKTNNYDYMVHIEQDVILTNNISSHVINTMIADNSNYAITDIKGNDYFYNICDVDISIFAINLNAYDSNNYDMYVTSDNIKDNLLNVGQTRYNVGKCNTIPPLLINKSNQQISEHINAEINSVYNSNNLHHWVEFHLRELNIENAINPVFIDSGRTYPLHAFIEGKLTIIKGIDQYAKHLKESRLSSNPFNLTSITNIIKYFGYQPIGDRSPNEHIELDNYYSKGIDIVIISKNQLQSIQKMLFKLRLDIPSANRIFVLDRCTDGTKEFLESCGEKYVERVDATGFCAGTARNLGLKHTNPNNDVLFLDGDRIPHNLTFERIIQMLYYFNISMIKNENDNRHWFVNVPSINTQLNQFNNNVWSSAILFRRSAINTISEVVGDNNLFDPIFDGHWGCEDEYIGDLAKHFGMLVGGFPSFIYVDGNTTNSNSTDPNYIKQVEKRKQLIGKLNTPISKNTTYMDKQTRRLHVENLLKHRERNRM